MLVQHKQYIQAFFQKGFQGSVWMPIGGCSFSLVITLTCRDTPVRFAGSHLAPPPLKEVKQTSHASSVAKVHVTKEETNLVYLKRLRLESNTVCHNAGLHAYERLACHLGCVSYSAQPGPSQAPWHCT